MILLIKLLLAHLIGDFFLQTDSWIKDKERKKWRSIKLLQHVIIHGILVAILSITEFGLKFWWMIPTIMGSHWMIDALTLQFQGKKAKQKMQWFLAAQSAHILVLALVWMVIEQRFEVLLVLQNKVFWIWVLCISVLTKPIAITLRIAISQWTPFEQDQANSLAKAGYFIGILERMFVFGFVISGYREGIGFLLATKSVFRFGDLNEAKDRNLTEYVLIGTLISFSLAILVGVAFNTLIVQ